jgi:hypothetical protein
MMYRRKERCRSLMGVSRGGVFRNAPLNKRMMIGEQPQIHLCDGTPRKVELDIQIREGPNSNMYEIKGGEYVSLTKGEGGTLDQINRQVAWRNEAPSSRSLTWQFKGRPSGPLLSKLKEMNITVFDWAGNPL